MPYLLNVVPVAHNTVLHRVCEVEDVSIGLRLITNVEIHADVHHRAQAWPTDDRRKDSTGLTVTRKAVTLPDPLSMSCTRINRPSLLL